MKPTKTPPPHKRIRRQSVKRAAQTRLYLARRREFLRNHPICAGWKKLHWCKVMATEIHHTRGRSGSLLLDERFWLPVCREAHRWITDHTTEARALGLVCALGKWNSKELTTQNEL